MGTRPNPDLLWQSLIAADQAGIKVEMVGGVGTWEAMPSPRHQRTIDIVRAAIQRSADHGMECGCVHYSDITIRFPEGSFMRPDIAIYCKDVPDEGSDAATEAIPEATVEIISPGYEAKDLEIGPPFLLANGVKDVVAFDPREGTIHHFRKSGVRVYSSPHRLALECGCIVTF